jgi:hypothetical protein
MHPNRSRENQSNSSGGRQWIANGVILLVVLELLAKGTGDEMLAFEFLQFSPASKLYQSSY